MRAVDEPVHEAPARAALREALAAEAREDWAESLALCRRALGDPEQHPDAFNLLGRLCGRAGDAANAIALQQFVLTLAPGHARAAADLRIARGAIRSRTEAEALFRAAAAHHPDVTCHHRAPGSLLPFAGMDATEHGLRAALAADPSLARAHAALGNVLARRGLTREAIDAYRLAAMLDWSCPDVHLALSAFFEIVRDEESAARHRHEALSRKRTYAASDPAAPRHVLVLAAPGGPVANAPLDFCINHTRIALHVHYLGGAGLDVSELPRHDVVLNAVEDAEAHAAIVEQCSALVRALGKPAINRPERLHRVRRSLLPDTLGAVAGCAVPATVRIERDALHGAARGGSLNFPVLVRPVDTHRGDWQELLASAAELEDYLARIPGAAFYVSAFVDYKSADGYYRKYRVIVVDGEAFPYHLAVSDAWKVHYHSSLMHEHAWMREEEERFFADPRTAFPAWHTVFPALADAVGLDYFGIDCALGPDGSVLVFECGPGMLVQCQDDPELFAYKYEHVPRIFAALDGLIERRAEENPACARSTPTSSKS